MLNFWITLLLANSAQAFELPALFSYGPPKTTIRYSGGYWAAARGESGSGTLQPRQQTLQSSIPFAKTEQSYWSVAPKISLLNLRTSAANIPPDLWNIQLGLNYSYTAPDESSWFGNFQPGSTSDKPFANWDVFTLSATVGRSFAPKGSGKFLLLVNYSNNRSFLNHIPLPGLAYIYSPSPTLRMIFGIPIFSIYWRFTDFWTFTTFTVIPAMIKSKLSYKIMGPFEAFTAFDWNPDSYLRSNRGPSNQRLYYDEKKLIAGVRGPIASFMLLELAVGRAFDRDLYDGPKAGEPSSGKLEFQEAWFAQTTLDARF